MEDFVMALKACKRIWNANTYRCEGAATAKELLVRKF
jgi:hypothetical protein